MYELIIIGAGPGGTAASVYAARKQLKTLLITTDFGGQSVVSSDIQNWIGTPSISGNDLALSFEKHVRAYAGEFVEIRIKERVIKVEQREKKFVVTTDSGTYETKTVLVTTGSSRKKLDVPGANLFENKGISYCASCDGPIFSGQDIAVVGGGNAGFESAAQLLAYCKSVTLLHRSNAFRADEITVEKVTAHPNMRILKNVAIKEIIGNTFVTGIKYEDSSGEHILPVSGIFVEIGMIPNTDFVRGLVNTDEYGRIIIDPRTGKTTLEGIWSAGDCTDVLYHQNNIAAGDAVRALEDIYLFLRARN
jgi:alkyl hydroperoxide reductase subunit F